MPHRIFYKYVFALFLSVFLSACGNDSADKNPALVAEPGDVIARVGDEVVTFSQLNAVLNSAAMAGEPVPAQGTPERNRMMQTLLNKAINANLIYLDAVKNNSDRQPSYADDMKRLEDALLAAIYKSRVMIGEVPVGEVDVLHYYNTQTSKEMELTDDLKLAIQEKIRQQRIGELQSTLRDRLRKNVEVVINEALLSSDHADKRSDADIVATYDKQPITWGQVKELMQAADTDSTEERLNRLELYIDIAIMTQKGREFGLEKDPVYIDRLAGYRKEYLINEYSKVLINRWEPSSDELKNFYTANMNTIVIPEARSVQTVLVNTKAEAETIKAQIDAGKITLSEAVQQYSLDPDAKRTQGVMDWVKQGAGPEGLNEFIFKLEPGVVSDPVASTAGWQLLKVLDVRAAQFDSFDDVETQNRTLMVLLQGKFNDYIAELKNQFNVLVLDDELVRQFKKEIDDAAELENKAEQKSSLSEQQDEKSHQWMVQPAAE